MKMDVINTATDEIITAVLRATKEPISESIGESIGESAESFKEWSSLFFAGRGFYLRKASEIVFSRKEKIGRLMTLAMDKPIAESTGEVDKTAKALQYYAEEGERVYGRIIPDQSKNFESHVIHYPVGPWQPLYPGTIP